LLGISLIIFWFIFQEIDRPQLGQLIRQTKIFPLLLALLVDMGLNLLIQAYRFGLIVRAIDLKLPLLESLFIRLGAEPLKFISPGRAGELLKAYYLTQRYQLPFFSGVGSLALEKFFNFCGLFIFFGMGFPFFSQNIRWQFLGFLSLVFLVLCGSYRQRAYWYRWSKQYWPRLEAMSRQFFGVIETQPIRRHLYLLFLSIIYQSPKIINTWLIFLALGLDVPFFAIFVYIPLVLVVTSLPASLGGMGAREAVFMSLFQSYASAEQLLLAGLLLTLIEYLFPVFLGLFLLPSFVARLTSPEPARTKPAPHCNGPDEPIGQIRPG
jgi:uncharacterized membrane protein YbhN (UPF0104 family)